MKELFATAHNTFYVRDEKGELMPMVELVLVSSEPEFTREIDGDSVALGQQRIAKTTRVVCSPNSLRLLLKGIFEILQEIEPKEAG